MYVLIIYKNLTYNLEIKEDISIINLKNLVITKIQRVKTSFDLIYNQKILLENELSLFKITKGARNARIIVLLKRSNSNKKININKKIELPLLPLSSKTNTINTDNHLKLNLDETEIFSNSSSKNLIKIIDSFQTSKSCKKANKKIIEYKTRNKVFEDIYNKKEETIINLMSELKNKILEYDDVLYRRTKNEYNDNNKILIYEKNIINYKDKQIQFLKHLLENFEGKKTFFSDIEINLKDFYSELSNYNMNKNANTFTQNYSIKKGKKIINKIKNIKMTNLKEEIIQKQSVNENKHKEIIKNDSFKNNEHSKDSSFNDNDNYNDKESDFEKLKEKNDKIFNDKIQNSKQNIQKKLDKNLTNNSNENINLKNIEHINQIKLRNHNTDKKVNKYTINKSFEKPKKIKYSSPINTIHKEMEHNYDIKKLESLFEIEEKKHENSENSSDIDSEDSDNLNNKKIKKKQLIERNLKERRSTLNLELGDSKIGYRAKLKDRITTHRIKKLGNVYSDFVI